MTRTLGSTWTRSVDFNVRAVTSGTTCAHSTAAFNGATVSLEISDKFMIPDHNA
jgi:hypothetical protein